MSEQTTNIDTASKEARNGKASSGTITIGGEGFGGLSGIIAGLLLAAAWGVVGIGYICVPGAAIAAVLGVVCAVMNLGVGFASVLLCLGVAIASVGLAYPILVGTGLLRHVLQKKQTTFSCNKNVLVITGIVAVAGSALAGLAVLLGGGDALVLPGFLQFLIA